MRIFIAPNSFKGSLSSVEAARAMRAGILRVLPGAQIDAVPIADGGDGTLVALSQAVSGSVISVESVHDPLLRPIEGPFLRMGPDIAVEMAAVSGLAMLAGNEADPLRASSVGLGEILRAAAAQRPRRLYVGIGGSASVDCGAGMLEALGSPFLTEDKRPVAAGGGRLHRAVSIDLSKAKAVFSGIELIALCDVDNPLTGPSGAALVFGPQKGADEHAVQILEENMKHAGAILSRSARQNVTETPGAGAAGGCGAALMALGARMQSGFSVIAEITGLEDRLASADLVLTAEGRLDEQTMMGKAPGEVLKLAAKHAKRAAAFAGSVASEGPFFTIVPGPMTLADAKARAGELLEAAVARFLFSFTSGANGGRK
jgi:glycerate kinase